MKATEVIKLLQELIEKNGDCDIYYYDDIDDTYKNIRTLWISECKVKSIILGRVKEP